MLLCAFVRLFGGPARHAAHMQQAVVGVLVVHGKQATASAITEREKNQAIMVHSHLDGLLLRRVGGVHPEGRHLACNADRLAPGSNHLGGVALGHRQLIAKARGDWLETQRGSSGQQIAHRGAAAQHGHQGGRRATPQHGPARWVGDFMDGGVATAVAVLH